MGVIPAKAGIHLHSLHHACRTVNDDTTRKKAKGETEANKKPLRGKGLVSVAWQVVAQMPMML